MERHRQQGVIALSGVALVALLGGNWIGTLIFRKMNVKNLRRMVYGFMILTGTLMLPAFNLTNIKGVLFP
jgi:uncharacterized membrane protein YfcA